jgi:hypothetical protein
MLPWQLPIERTELVPPDKRAAAYDQAFNPRRSSSFDANQNFSERGIWRSSC